MENQLGGIKNLSHANRGVDKVRWLESELKQLQTEVRDLRGCFDDIMTLVRMSSDMQPNPVNVRPSASTSPVHLSSPEDSISPDCFWSEVLG
jgi:hypothetical protein